MVQIAASFVLVVAAGATVKTLLALESARTGFDAHDVLAVNIPVMHDGKTPRQVVDFYREATRRIRELPGVQNIAVGTAVPWRDADNSGALELSADGHIPAAGEERPRATVRVISPGFFATLGLPIIEGRDFNDGDRNGSERVAIVSQSVVQRMFPKGDALKHHVMWTDPLLKAVPLMSTAPLRIIGVVADMDDMKVVPVPTMTVYRPFDQEAIVGGGRVFVHVRSNPYSLVTPITPIVRDMSADQPVEEAATLEDIRAKVLSPQRLNVMVSGIFAGVGPAHCGGGRCGRARVLRQCTHARVWRPAGGRVAAAASVDTGDRRGCGHGHWRTCCRVGRRVLAGTTGRHSIGRSENAGRAAGDWLGVGAATCRRNCVNDTGGASSSSRRGRGAANGVRSSHDAQISLDNLYLGVKRRRNVELRTACPLEVRVEKGVHAV